MPGLDLMSGGATDICRNMCEGFIGFIGVVAYVGRFLFIDVLDEATGSLGVLADDNVAPFACNSLRYQRII